MQNEISFEEAKKFSGYLEKKSKGLISKWQKRYFHILEGKIIVYADKAEDIEVKGQINIDQITIPVSLEDRVFSFTLETKDFVLRAKDEEEKNKWMNILKLLKNKLSDAKKKDNQNDRRMSKRDSLLTNTITSNRRDTMRRTMNKKNKLTSAGKVTADIIRRNGFVTNKEQKLSTNLLKSKGIDKLINLKDPKINSRIYYGFIYKRHKIHDYFQKRWFFLFSARPLFDNYYLEDDTDLDQKKQKDWIKFDSLYYFKYADKDETSESVGSLELVKSHKVELLDKDDKFYLYLDVEDRRFDFYCDSKAERDIWFEVLKNSRRTAKEYQASVTKHPRNIEYLYSFFLIGEKELIKKIEKEKTSIVGDYEATDEFDIFEFNQNNLENSIESTIDGCNSNFPPRKDLLKSYTEHMDKEYLEIIKSFWERKYKDMENKNILKMGMMLFVFGERLLTLNVNDENFLKNGKELTKIYLKKTYQNILSIIENILKKEREIKAIKHEMGYYYTRGPNDLFEILSNTFDLLKENKNKVLYEMTLNLFNSSINQYLLGVETVLTNLDIIIEKEFLLAVANNSLNMIELLNSLLDEIKDMKVLTDQEINDNLKLKKIMSTINKVSEKAIISFVFLFLNDLGNDFKNVSFKDLDMTKVLISTNEIFGPYRQYMNSLVLKKSWNEILKLTLYHYIHLLLSSSYSRITVDQIKEKLNGDIIILSETYEGLVGKHLTLATIKILNDIHDFLIVSPYMISSCCLTLRQYIGPTFNLAKVKALIKLRTDFNDDDSNDGIQQCKEVLENYNRQSVKEEQGTMNYFQLIEKEMKRQENVERRIQREKTLKLEKLEKKVKKGKNGKEGVEGEEEEEDEEEEEENIEDDNDANIANFDLDDFLNDEGEEQEEKEDEENHEIFKYQEEDKDVEQEEISDITYEGYMKKKTHSTWQTRYFQVKNGYLYWFKDKTSSIVQNKISIKNTLRVDSHKDKKFMMIVKETGEGDEEGEKSKKEGSGKVYKFSCQSDEEKIAWVSAITTEMKRLNKIQEKTNDIKLEIPVRKKIIIDYFNLPAIDKDLLFMRKKVLEEMNDENYFQPSLRKIEALRRKQKREEKERKRKEKEEEERKKREEKEERERKKREEKEERERKKREEKEEKERKKREEHKKIEEDMKSGKKVGIKNRLKFWFRSNVEGIKTDDKTNDKEELKENEKTENNNGEIKTNEFNLDDLGLDDDEEEVANENNKEENNKENNINKIDNINNTNINQEKNDNKEKNDKKENEIPNNNNNKNIIDNKVIEKDIKIDLEENKIEEENKKEEENKIEEEIKINNSKKEIQINNENKNNSLENKNSNNLSNNKIETKAIPKESNNQKNNNKEKIEKKEEKNEPPRERKRDKIKGWFKNTFGFGGKKEDKKQEKEENKKSKENEIIENKKEENKNEKIENDVNQNKIKIIESDKKELPKDDIKEEIIVDNKEENKIEETNLVEKEKDNIKNEEKEQKGENEEEKIKEENEIKEKENNEVEKMDIEQLEEELMEIEKRDKEKKEKERIENERLEKERLEKERMEKERLEKEKLEIERLEKERLERERMEKEKIEREKLERERLERERIEKERLERERMEKEKLERERIEKERLLRERMEKERIERERLERERLEKERIRQEKIRLEKEKAEKERIKKEKELEILREKERIEKENKERIEREKQEKLIKEKIEKQMQLERIELEKIENERLAKEKIEKEKEKEKERIEKMEREGIQNGTIIKEKLKVNEEIKDKSEEEEEKRRLEFNAKLLPKIRKDQRRAEKMYKVVYGAQNIKKIEEKIEQLRERIPNIKTKYEINMENNKNDIEYLNKNEEIENPVKDWWGDIFKK